MGAGGIGCGASIAKILLFAFNVCFFLAGAGLMGVGIWIRVDPKSAEFARIISPTSGAGDPLLQAASIVLAAVGGFILLVGFLGCCGACCENTCMLTTYATIVIILAIIQIVAGILAAVFSSKVRDSIGKGMDEGIDKYRSTEAIQTAWDSMQVWLGCCGRNGSDDWSTSTRSNFNRTYWGTTRWTQAYPPSCCIMKDKDPKKINKENMRDPNDCMAGVASAYNAEGCQKKLEDWFHRNAGIIMGIAFGVLAIQFVVAIMACCLKNAIKEEQ